MAVLQVVVCCWEVRPFDCPKLHLPAGCRVREPAAGKARSSRSQISPGEIQGGIAHAARAPAEIGLADARAGAGA